MEGDVNYKISLPDVRAYFNWNSIDTLQGVQNFIGGEVNAYVNFTLHAEIFQRTKQQVTVSLIPFRAYPLYHWGRSTKAVSASPVTFYNRIGSYLSLGEIHTVYYNNWKACGNSFVNNDGSNNFDDTFLIAYCGYNTQTEHASEDSTNAGTYGFEKYFGPRYERDIKLFEMSKSIF